VPQASIAAKIHQSLDVHGDFAAKIAFHQEVAVNDLTDLNDFAFAKEGPIP
jgi:hypothetical protein